MVIVVSSLCQQLSAPVPPMACHLLGSVVAYGEAITAMWPWYPCCIATMVTMKPCPVWIVTQVPWPLPGATSIKLIQVLQESMEVGPAKLRQDLRTVPTFQVQHPDRCASTRSHASSWAEKHSFSMLIRLINAHHSLKNPSLPSLSMGPGYPGCPGLPCQPEDSKKSTEFARLIRKFWSLGVAPAIVQASFPAMATAWPKRLAECSARSWHVSDPPKLQELMNQCSWTGRSQM